MLFQFPQSPVPIAQKLRLRMMVPALALAAGMCLSGFAVQAQGVFGALERDGVVTMSDGAGGVQSATARALLAHAAQTGKVRVIVQFDPGNFTPEGALDDIAALAQRSRIAAGQRQLAGVMERAELFTRFESVPMISVLVDARDLERLMSMPGVIAVHEDVPVAPTLNNSVPLIDGQIARRRGATGEGFSVAVLDTGTQLDHDAFDGKIVAGACFSTNNAAFNYESLCPGGATQRLTINSSRDCNPNFAAGCGHGTHVAGIALSEVRNRLGVAPEANLVSMQVFSKLTSPSCPGGRDACVLAFWTDILRALEQVDRWRNRHDIAAVNMSLGGGLSSGPCNEQILRPMIATLRSRGVATVIASGNDFQSNSIAFPACIPEAVAVGSTTKSDQVSAFSNHLRAVSVLAPGSNISAPRFSPRRTDLMTSKDGTSMAAPHVAGAFAALRTSFPDASVDDIERALACSSTVVSRGIQPLPRLNMLEAYQALNRPMNGAAWGFGNAAQVERWTQVSNTWTHAGNRMRTDFDMPGSALALSPFCGQDMRVNARLARNDTSAFSGILLSAYATGNAATGLFFRFSGAGASRQASIVLYEGLNLATQESSQRVLCENNNAISVRSGGINNLRVTLRNGTARFLINGTEVCSTNDLYGARIGSAGILAFGENPANPADRLDVFRFNATALSATGPAGASATQVHQQNR